MLAALEPAVRLRTGQPPRGRPHEVTAVFVANDQMALGVLRGMHEVDLQFNDISIVGFDDIPEAFISPRRSQPFARNSPRSVPVPWRCC